MPGCDSSCFTKTKNAVGDPQQNLSMTCSWNDILLGWGEEKEKKMMFTDQSCLVLFLPIHPPKSSHLRNSAK